MAKELPYFKFYVSEWLNGDITLEDYKIQGLFINVCSYYWSKDCILTKVNLLKKFRGFESDIELLILNGIIKEDNENVIIYFLYEQIKSKEVQVVTNRINGLKGGRPKKEETENKPTGLILETETKANDNPNETNIKESKVKESKEDNIKKEILNSKIWIEKISKNKFLTIEKCNQYLNRFLDDAELKGELNDLSDVKKHFVNWLNLELKKEKANEPVKIKLNMNT